MATIPLGYTDGFRSDFSNGWEDEVIIWDNEHITLEELAEQCNTINYEILCIIESRVPRKFI